ncbi:hypothetical protein LFZ31_18245 [Salmonella enterica subsp. enterica serovar Newport str. S09097]|nr:hypothetical protein LFZ31_18245 [Salmonella enterica subsp. enterica serovar Newport str. S09097]
MRIACLRESTDNPLYARLLEEISDKKQAAQWLLLAERQMDEAAVFTIHGFLPAYAQPERFRIRYVV